MTSELKGVLEELKSKQLASEENDNTINTRLTDFFNAGNRRYVSLYSTKYDYYPIGKTVNHMVKGREEKVP